MSFKYKKVYIENYATVTGPYENEGPLGKYFDKSYKDLYFGTKTWEDAEKKLILDSIKITLKKQQLKNKDIDLFISGDLLNQIVASNYAAEEIKIPYLGIYSACASAVEGLIIGANMIESKQINNCLCTVSSHNNGAEKQFRYPVEYGGPKPLTQTFTVTGSACAYLGRNKKGIRIESATIGTACDYGIKDIYNMGAVMAPAAAETIYKHLKETNRKIDYYDLILTGDLGKYGKAILKQFMEIEYGIKLKNYEDTACMIYDLNKKNLIAGASGPACAPLVTYSYIFNKMLNHKISRVLLVATGALMNSTMVNEKKSIPSIAHAISLEVVK